MELTATIEWEQNIDPDAVARLAALLLNPGGSTPPGHRPGPQPPATNTGERDAVVGGGS